MNRQEFFAALRPAFPSGIPSAAVPVIDGVADKLGMAPSTQDAADGARRINAAGLALIKASEGLRLDAYRCPADVPTIGYGSTGAHVHIPMRITEAEAEQLLRDDLDRFERGVAQAAPRTTEGQFAALVSFAFNLGLGALKDSTLLRLHNAGDYAGAAAQFARWVKAGGKTLPGLVKRRAAEAALYRGDGA